ncbi:MAG: hypothetical protein MUP76_10630 [Acidimicrobiia bacterium]|nr:hypothetical protein [Acidimicrobiia bacterium]
MRLSCRPRSERSAGAIRSRTMPPGTPPDSTQARNCQRTRSANSASVKGSALRQVRMRTLPRADSASTATR